MSGSGPLERPTGRDGPTLPPGPGLPAAVQTWAWVRRPGPFLDGCAARFGATFTLRFVGGRAFVIVSEPTDVRQVFTAPADLLLAGRANASFKPFLGSHSLIVLDGPEHRRHRRALAPPLQAERLHDHEELVCDVTARALAGWPLGRPFQLVEALHHITLGVIFKTMFGMDDEERERRLTRLVARAVTRVPAYLAFVPVLRRELGGFGPWARFVASRRALEVALLDEIGRARRAPGQRGDVLAKLLAEGGEEALTDQELCDELVTLLGAGHETTTSALSWTLRFILASPEVTRRCEREVVEGHGMKAGGYVEATILEAMRLCPPIPVMPRWLARDADLAGTRLAAGTYVAPCAYLTHRDPRVFPEPLAFRPERFLEDPPDASRFYPFGGGARTCIGASFAIMEMRAIVATIIARCRLELLGVGGRKSIRRSIILNPSDGTQVVLRGRS